MFRRSTFLLSLAGVVACSASVVTGAEGLKVAISNGDLRADALSTDATLYTARRLEEPWPGVFVYGFTVVTRYVNPTNAPVYLWTCYPGDRSPVYSVVPAVTVSNGVAYNPVRACVGHDRPIRVGPGESYAATLELRGPNTFDGITHQPLDRIVEGRFRIVFAVQSCRTEGDCPIRDEALTHSNEFTVQIAR